MKLGPLGLAGSAAPGPVTYEFRVLSRYEADFPFQDGTSNTVDVHEH